MSRPPRVEVAGGIYHVIARGNERRDVFRDDEDRRLYLGRLAECRDRYEFGVLAYCLMPNHIHLAIERGPVPLSKVILALHGFYSQKFNLRHERVGHLFQGRYKAFLVEQDRYLEGLIRYIHNNPVKAGLVEHAQAYPWSSDRFYRSGNWPEWLDIDRVLSRLAPTPVRAAAAYRRWMGRNGSDDGGVPGTQPQSVASSRVGRSSRAVRCEAQIDAATRRRWTPGGFAAQPAIPGFSIAIRSRLRGQPESRARIIVAYVGGRDTA